MLIRRDFVKGTTAALAASLGLRSAARGDMAPEPEKAKAWHEKVTFGTPLPVANPMVRVGHGQKKRVKVLGYHMTMHDPSEAGWPVDIRCGWIKETGYASGIEHWAHVWMFSGDSVECLGDILFQNMVSVRHAFQRPIEGITIDKGRVFGIGIISPRPIAVTGWVELQEVTPSKPAPWEF